MKKSIFVKILWGLALVALLFAYGGSFGLLGLTLIDPLWAWIGALCVALIAWVLIFKRMKGLFDASGLVRLAAYAVAATGVLLCAFLSLNYFAGSGEVTYQTAAVKDSYMETRHKKERVGRNRWREGAPYYVYYIKVEMPGGRDKDLQVSRNRYNRYKRKPQVNIPCRKGLFGITVIDRSQPWSADE